MMNRILVVNVNWMGDVIFSTPIFYALKEKYPQAKLSCLCVPRVRDVLSHVPAIDEILIYDEDGKHKGLSGKLAVVAELRNKNSTRRFYCIAR